MFAGLKLALSAAAIAPDTVPPLRPSRPRPSVPDPSLISHIFPGDPRGRSHYSSCHSRQRNEAAAALSPNLRQRRRRWSAESRRLVSPPPPLLLACSLKSARIICSKSVHDFHNRPLCLLCGVNAPLPRSLAPHLDPNRKAQSRRAELKWTDGRTDADGWTDGQRGRPGNEQSSSTNDRSGVRRSRPK